MQIKLNNQKINIIKADNFKTRLVGLMGKTKINYGIYFPNCNAVHTFFMKEEIDILGLNKDKQVIYIYRNIPKNKIIKINNNDKKTSILELPKNASKNIAIGSIIKFLD